MADEVDPRFEARLRTAFRSEVQGRPLGISEDAVFATWRSHRIRSVAVPASLVAAVALVAVVAVVVAGMPGLATRQGAAAGLSATAAPALASFDTLTAMLPAGVAAATVRGENVTAGTSAGDTGVELGAVGAGSPVWYALSCLGDKVTITFDTGDTTPDTMSLACGTGPVSSSLDWEAGPAIVSVSASANLPWRIVLGAGGGPARNLESFEELRLVAQRARTTGGITIGKGEDLDRSAASATQPTDLGAVGAVPDIQLVLDCIGGDIEVRVVAGDTVLAGYKGACTPAVDVQDLILQAPDPRARLLVVASPGVAWRLLAVGPAPTESQVP
jgi:hypothetical protein